jgi:hypothetical protein
VALAIGTVRCLVIGDDFAITTIDETAGGSETLVLWSVPDPATSFTRIMHSMWVSLLREAKAGNIIVQVAFADTGGEVTSVQLGES